MRIAQVYYSSYLEEPICDEAGKRSYKKTYHLEIREAPAWKIARARIYHAYDMRAFKLRIFKKVIGPVSERLHPQYWHLSGTYRRRNSTTWEMDEIQGDPSKEKIPWDIRQDLRCFKYSDHPVLMNVEITEDQYNLLSGSKALILDGV